MIYQALIAGIIGSICSVLLIRPVCTLSLSLGALDIPGGRKDHNKPTPRLGGVAIMAGIVIGTLCGALSGQGEHLIFGRFATRELVSLGAAVMLIFLLGLLDDLRSVSAPGKFAIQIIAAGALVSSGWQFEVLALPFVGTLELGPMAPLLSVLWIVGITNAINLIDGLDGLATGVSAIIGASFLALALAQGDTGTVVLASAMSGACLGFLHHNWFPARVFMGDSGSMTLGFLLATVSLHSSLKAPAAVAVLVPILALGLPTIDTLLVMVIRFLESPGHPVLSRLGRMFQADRRHLHHVLLHLAPRRSQIVLTIYAVVAVFCFMALTVALSRSGPLALALLGVEVTAIYTIRRIGLQSMARKTAESQRLLIRQDLRTWDLRELTTDPVLQVTLPTQSEL